MSLLSPAQALAIYGGTAYLAYLETRGYEKDNRFVLCLPSLVLSVLSLSTTMHPKPRFLSALAFVVVAAASYVQSTSRAARTFAFFLSAVANVIYYASFKELVSRWSVPLCATSVLLLLVSFLHLFHDLVVAIPFLVIVITLLLCSHAFVFVASGSLCHYGLHGDYDATQASFLRLFGSALSWLSSFLFLHNAFTQHTVILHTVSRIIFYFAHALLFFANERTF